MRSNVFWSNPFFSWCRIVDFLGEINCFFILWDFGRIAGKRKENCQLFQHFSEIKIVCFSSAENHISKFSKSSYHREHNLPISLDLHTIYTWKRSIYCAMIFQDNVFMRSKQNQLDRSRRINKEIAENKNSSRRAQKETTMHRKAKIFNLSFITVFNWMLLYNA